MGALSKIKSAGFVVTLVRGGLEISPASDLTLPQREFLKLHKAEIITELSTYQKVKNWLSSIGETDQTIIDEILERCEISPEILAYFLQRADSAGFAKATMTQDKTT